VVGHVHPAKPHEYNVLLGGFLQLAATVNVGHVTIHHQLQQRQGMVTAAATTTIPRQKGTVIYLVQYRVYDTCRMIGGNKFFQTGRQQQQLLLPIRLKDGCKGIFLCHNQQMIYPNKIKLFAHLDK